METPVAGSDRSEAMTLGDFPERLSRMTSRMTFRRTVRMTFDFRMTFR